MVNLHECTVCVLIIVLISIIDLSQLFFSKLIVRHYLLLQLLHQQQNLMLASPLPPMPTYSPGPHQLLSPTSPTHGGSQIGTATQPGGTSGLASPGIPHGIGHLSSTVTGLSPNGIRSAAEPLQSPLHR